jgi:hypothetical protein
VAQWRVLAAKLLDLVLGEVADRQAMALDPTSRDRRDFSCQGLDQRRLARAVRSKQAEPRPGTQRKLDGACHRAAVVPEHGILEREQRVRCAQGLGELEVERRIDVRGRDTLEPIERLQATLRLTCLRRLGAKPLDERRHVCDLALLLLVERLLHGQPRCALHFESAVIAGVQRERRPLEVRDVRHCTVEEVTVVRYQQQRAAVCGEPLFEPDDGVEVEVIRGLVEQHQVGSTDQCLCEVQAHAPAAREVGDRAREITGSESEACKERGRAGARAVPVDRLDSRVQFGQRMTVVGRFCDGERAFGATEFLVAVEHELDRRARQRRRLLRNRGNAPVARYDAIAGFTVDLAAQQGEQARLARAVGADHADAPAGRNLQ